jgi:catechol 2,3-dioxygenase-like lactoylglutathione lyase family enzyme
MRSVRFGAVAACVILFSAPALAPAAPSKGPPSAQDKARTFGPIIKGAHFHHLHLNVTDRQASIAFYVSHFKAVRTRFAGQDAVWTQRSYILFDQVPSRAPPAAGSAINHFGWGAPDAQAEFRRQKALGTPFITEIRDISESLGGRPGQFYFMYVRAPDGEQIELNTDPDDNFGHIHMDSADPLAAGAWYRNLFGFTDAPPYFPQLVAQTGSGRISRQFFDNVNVIINPARAGETIKPTRGNVVDHIGVSVPNLAAAMAAVRAHRIEVLDEPADGPCKPCRHAFIEGPDKIAIELIEDHSPHPPITD